MRVEIYTKLDHIAVVATNADTKYQLASPLNGRASDYIEVYPPNWFERLIGMTYELKLRRAMTKVQYYCDKVNETSEEIRKTYKAVIWK